MQGCHWACFFSPPVLCCIWLILGVCIEGKEERTSGRMGQNSCCLCLAPHGCNPCARMLPVPSWAADSVTILSSLFSLDLSWWYKLNVLWICAVQQHPWRYTHTHTRTHLSWQCKSSPCCCLLLEYSLPMDFSPNPASSFPIILEYTLSCHSEAVPTGNFVKCFFLNLKLTGAVA